MEGGRDTLCELLNLQVTHIVSFSCMQVAHTAGVSHYRRLTLQASHSLFVSQTTSSL